VEVTNALIANGR